MRLLRQTLGFLLVGLLVGCGSSDEPGSSTPDNGGGSSGEGGSAGKGGSAGASGKAGSSGASGQGGGSSGASGQSGAAGTAGASGAAGQAGAGGASGASGQAGAGGAGAGGESGASGQSGAAGSAGAAGAAGAGGGAGGAAGASGSAGSGGAVQCASGLLCGGQGLCCAVGEECLGGACVPACASGVRCEQVCCEAGQACAGSACVTPTDPCQDSVDCGPKEFCDAVLKKCLPGDPGVLSCQVSKPTKPLAPKLLWSWTGSTIQPDYDQAMSAPLVIDLDGDGSPEVIGCSRKPRAKTGGDYDIRGFVRVMRGDTGADFWGADVDAYKTTSQIDTTMAMAAADLLGDGQVAILARLTSGEIVAFNADGSVRWTSIKSDGTPYQFPKISAYAYSSASSIVVADMNGDGDGEIVVGGVILTSTGVVAAGQGQEKLAYVGNYSASSIVADVDGDGAMEVLGGNRVMNIFGVDLWKQSFADGFPAIADFDLDGKPELVAVGNDDKLRIIDAATGTVRAEASFPSQYPGNPTIADFDGDGQNEIGVQYSGPNVYTVWEYEPLTETLGLKWQTTMAATSGLLAATAFDFNGDGEVEVVAHDDLMIRVLKGSTGEVQLELEATHGTWTEFVSIADVNGDGSADLLFSANNDYYTTGNNGYFVYEDPDHAWMPTRRIWNQQSYHITNIRSDGKLPKPELASWGPGGFNNYRVSAQGKATGAAPDLVPTLSASLGSCPAALELVVSVQNQGSLGVAAGVGVEVFEGAAPNGVSVGQGTLSKPLLPGQSETVTFQVPVSDDAPKSFYVVIDGGSALVECVEDNNTATLGLATCGKL